MSADDRPAGGVTSVDIKVRVPELTDIGPFWIRGYPTRHTFTDLYAECINHDDVLASRLSLSRARASRHFWVGERMMLRGEAVAEAVRGTQPTGEISLVLRPDYYRVGPPQYLRPGLEYIYLDAEEATGVLAGQILGAEDQACCFDFQSFQRRRLSHDRSLADYGLWPAWQDAAGQEFPARALLRLVPRVSWQPLALLLAGGLAGAGGGYVLMRTLLH